MLKRYIITGAPGTGKTSLIHALQNKGYNCFNEVSRKVIKQQQFTNGNKTPWEDVVGFCELVSKQTLLELKNSITTTTFVDRSLADSIAYLQLKNKPVNPIFTTFNYHKYYHKTVFLLSPWEEIYTEDPQRLQSFNDTKKLHQLLIKVYTELGFTICIIPKTTLVERLNFITKQIQ